ncbi:uncharacterized protein LOC107828732 [Nicotiana tabacum]|uniref:Uncharacterized protein LOC107828732 n=2 Tax=Nicotiana TaxID=4085 RepID=A0A1S4DDU5_TOBAC|nr:PREDICTED: uncharacterized protein LOC104244075 isoform X1 [Nicotiana sylvestris]XP_016511586.1 PREDICTED: uncharacterized protein LOC107828732 [Nicotiana tabacum]
MVYCDYCIKFSRPDYWDDKVCCRNCGKILYEENFTTEPTFVKIMARQKKQLERALKLLHPVQKKQLKWPAELKISAPKMILAKPEESKNVVDARDNFFVQSGKIDPETEEIYEEPVDNMAN